MAGKKGGGAGTVAGGNLSILGVAPDTGEGRGKGNVGGAGCAGCAGAEGDLTLQLS
ncbi:MAG TPA: hypothetical protein V6C85_30970 [Allocoleopsis sp.]